MAMLRYRCGTLPNAINRRLSIKLEQQRVTGSRTVSKHPWPPRSPPLAPAPRPGPRYATRGGQFFFLRISAFGLDAVPATSFGVSKVFVGFDRTPPPGAPGDPQDPATHLSRSRYATPPNFFERLGLRPRRAPIPHITTLSGVNRWLDPPGAKTPLLFFSQKIVRNAQKICQ